MECVSIKRRPYMLLLQKPKTKTQPKQFCGSCKVLWTELDLPVDWEEST